LSVCDSFIEGKNNGINSALFNSRDTDSVFVTCKDYKTVTGVASRLNNISLED